MQNAQELLVGSALEYIKGISVLRIFGKGKEGKGKVDQAFENKCRSDIAVTISTAGIMKLYEAVFKITSCLLFLLSALLYLLSLIHICSGNDICQLYVRAFGGISTLAEMQQRFSRRKLYRRNYNSIYETECPICKGGI